MPRIRTIKPEFFLDHELDRLTEAHQKLFIGLWTLADAEGRLVDDPRRIKAQVFPYRDYDVDEMLTELARPGFIRRYENSGYRVIWVVKFSDHQRPHPKEPVFGLPHPPEQLKETASREKKRQEINESISIPSRPAFKGKEGKGREGNDKQAAEPQAPREKPADLQGLWNEVAHPSLPRWQEMGKAREGRTKTRLSERPLAQWKQIITRISASSFCLGENDRGWVASPDWILQPDTAAKVLEGKYDNRGSGPKKVTPWRDLDGDSNAA